MNRIEMRNINKSFPGVQALKDVSMEIKPGEVMVLLGENGAGKSTLMKILAGVYTADSGTITASGEELKIRSTRDAEKHGIYMIYQELNLVPNLSVCENLFLGREPRLPMGIADFRAMRSQAKEILDEMNLSIDPMTLVKDLSTAKAQMVEICRALLASAEVLIMDEPTAAITDQETQELFRQIRKLTAKGVSIFYISHRLQEMQIIGDRIFVMRDGAHVGTVDAKSTQSEELIKMMVGREIGDLFPKVPAAVGEELLRVENLSVPGVLSDISFSLKAGEVLGFAGLMGAGRTELMRALFGADSNVSGSIFIRNKPVRIRSPKDAVSSGMAFVTEDRKNTGILSHMPVFMNITISTLKQYTRNMLLRRGLEFDIAKKHVGELSIKTPTVVTPIASLSGGNQQKAILARWLCTQADIFILDEPTRGIDVGSKREIYLLINELAKLGKAVILVSSDLPEVLGMSDRVAVMSGGRLTGILSAREADQVSVMRLATMETAVS